VFSVGSRLHVNAPKDAPADGDVLFNSMSSFDKSLYGLDGISPGTFKPVGHRATVPQSSPQILCHSVFALLKKVSFCNF
jgi:hypothetical protein